MQVMQTGKKMGGNRFDAVQFEPYVHQAYPKMVGGSMLEPIIVNDEREEEEFLSKQKKVVSPKVEQEVTPPSAPLSKKDKLLAQAEKLGIEVDPDWSIKKLEREIGKA